MSQLVSAAIELSISDRVSGKRNGWSVRGLLDLLFNQLVKQRRAWILDVGMVPCFEQLFSLLGGKKRQPGKGIGWLGDDAFEQRFIVLEPATDCRGFE